MLFTLAQTNGGPLSQLQSDPDHVPATVTLIPGDGIGPEITIATLKILDAAGARIAWEERMPRPSMSERKDDTAVDPAVESIRRTRVALKGPLTTPIGTGHRSMNVALRKELDLYANL